MKRNKILSAILALSLVASFAACSSTEEPASTSTPATSTEASSEEKITGTVTGSGSSALLPLAQDAADKFKALYPDISITLNGGGSGTGLKQIADGSVDIGNSDLYAEEKLDEETAKDLVDHKVCVVTMAAIVNNELGATVNNLTKDQLISIFTGEVTNWSEVGGPDEKVLLVTRPDSSGTRALFTQWALDGNSESADASYLETDNSGELMQTVKDNKGAIGYVALSYLVNNTEVTAVSIDGVAPTIENTYSGEYPVWGYEHMYTNSTAPNAAADLFIEYIMSDEYASHIEAQGYGAGSKMEVER